jgi:hypothetical protein
MRLVPALTSTTLAVGLLAAAAPAVSADASITATASCKPLLKKSKKAARAGQKGKAKRLRTKYRACQASITVREALAGYTFTGVRGDGEPTSVTLCENGKWESRSGARPVGISTGTAWYVRYPQFTSATKWVTQVAEYKDRNRGGWSVGVARDGDAFQVGIASFDTVTDLGAVTRTPAGAACG